MNSRRSIWTAAVILAACSCSPKLTPGTNTVIEYRDSTIYKETVKDSLIFVPIPLGKDQAIVHLGDTSRLETSVARSVAYVGSDGLLHHSLENKSDEKLPVVVPIKSVEIFSGVSHKEAHTITQYVEVEKSLSWWQKFRQGAFWWLILLCLVGFRREIFAIVKKFI